jgi:putative ABC transport system permease protein
MNEVRSRGLITENLSIAIDILRAHKLRSGLIILGVGIGVASLMGMVSILLGLGEKITQDISSSELSTLTVTKYDVMVGGLDEAMLHRKDITEENAKAIREGCPSLKHVAFIIEPQGLPLTLRAGNEKSRMIQVVGAQPSLMGIWSLDLEAGRIFTDEETSHRAKVVVLGHSPRRDLFPNTDPVGKTVKIGNDDFTVVGAFVERKTLFGGMAENFVMIPYTTYKGTLWKERDQGYVWGAIRDGVSLESAREEVIRVMRQQRKLKASQDNDFAVTSSDAVLELLDRITGPIAGILAAISSIGLLVGGIGVMNMMLVSVTERTGEIGIRKAVGATRTDILWQFLIEAAVLTSLGGILGTCAGWSAATAVSYLTGLPSRLPIPYIILAVVFSALVGVFFGLYPASRASKLTPVQAMGHEK